jgi:hypothetical protein
MPNHAPPPVDDEVLTAIHVREHTERPAGVKGGFRLSLASGKWWWSPGMFQLHGYRTGQLPSVRPTSRLLLAHRHPADRHAFAQAWRHLLADGGVVAVRYRIVGVDDRVRPVFAMASLRRSDGPADGRQPPIVTGVMQSDGPVR